MFLLSAQNNFYIILSSYVEGLVQKNSSLNFMSSVGFQVSKIWMFFWKLFVELFWKSFSGRNSSPEPIYGAPCFWFSSSLPYGLEEPRELRDLIRWVLGGIQNCKKFSALNFFLFLSHHYGFMNCFEILNFVFLISYLGEFQPVKY